MCSFLLVQWIFPSLLLRLKNPFQVESTKEPYDNVNICCMLLPKRSSCLQKWCLSNVWPTRCFSIHTGIVNYKNQFIQFVRVPRWHCRSCNSHRAFSLMRVSVLCLCVFFFASSLSHWDARLMNLFVKYSNSLFRAIFIQVAIKFFDATCSSVYIIHFSIGFITRKRKKQKNKEHEH